MSANQKKHKILYKQVDDLVPYVMNSRTHSDEQVSQIASSIKEFGFTNPVLIDEENGIIAGHGRIMAAKKIGLESVPCLLIQGLTEPQKKAYVIADNKLALNAGWNDEMLRIELESLQDMDFDLSLTGFSDEELDSLLNIEMITPEEEIESSELNPRHEPITTYGDVWILGRHRVMCGDSRSVDEMDILMNGVVADLWITDPPYNISYEGKTEDSLTIENDSMGDKEFKDFLIGCYSTAKLYLKDGGSFYIWHASSETYNFVHSAIESGLRIRQTLIWVKQMFTLGRQDYQWKHEPCLYGWKDGASHLWNNDRSQTTVLEFDKPSRNDVHPTMKPVELFEYQIKNSSKKGEVVLDSFGGSGTTIVACERTGRSGRCMEIDPRYCDVIISRWQELTGLSATHSDSDITFEEMENERK